jgi:hypothetical protein
MLIAFLVFAGVPAHALHINAPDRAENGAVIHVEITFDQPLTAGQSLDLLVNDQLAAQVRMVKGKLSAFTTRVQGSRSNTTIAARALGTSGNEIGRTSRGVRLTILAPVSGSPTTARVAKAQTQNGNIKILMAAENGFTGPLVLQDTGFHAEIFGSASLARNPFIGLKGDFSDQVTASINGRTQNASAPQRPATLPTTAAQKSTSTSSVNISRSSANSNKWPAGVEPGNLYAIDYRARWENVSRIILVAAKTRAEAVALVESKWAEWRKLFRNEDTPEYQLVMNVLGECTGPNWGAIVYYSAGNGNVRADAWSCGAKTPREAILEAAKRCSSVIGKLCTFDRIANGRVPGGEMIVSIGHSGAKPWRNPQFAHFPVPQMVFAALGASTAQSSIDNLYISSPQEAIEQFGKACGKTLYGRDVHSCWITSKNLGCIWESENQYKCVDAKLTADGYLP